MIDWLLNFVWTTIPLWIWVVIGGVLLGAAWRTFGWQGVVGGLLALLTLGAYRQGYRDADARKPPMVPVEDYERAIAGEREPEYRPAKKRRTLMDILNGR